MPSSSASTAPTLSLHDSLSAHNMARLVVGMEMAGKPVVTASLKARSLAVLAHVAAANPATPVIFCHADPVFSESEAHRAEIIDRLGLTNVSVRIGSEPKPQSGVWDHAETLWAESANGLGRVRETVRLNKALAPYDVWISAVHHETRGTENSRRTYPEGHLLKVDLLKGWSDEAVLRFLRKQDIPLHPRAVSSARPQYAPVDEAVGAWSF